MAAAKYNIVLAEQGATFELFMEYQNDDYSPIDMTSGWLAALQIRSAPGGTVLADLTSYIVLSNGTITIKVPGSITSGWTWGHGVYDLKLTDDLGDITRLVEGTFKISPEVTQ